MSGGWNPQYGWDAGRNPPMSGPAFGTSFAGPSPAVILNGGFDMFNGMPQATYGYQGPPAMYMGPSAPCGFPQVPGSGQSVGPPSGPGPAYLMPQNGYSHPVPVFPGQGPRLPSAHPVVNADCAALNLMNSTGGAGCEPGYNYYFPQEHTKIHVIKSQSPPWRLPEGMSLTFGAYHVPCSVTLGDLMKGFGAANPKKKNNKITEVIQGGNGRWYKGVTWQGDESDNMKKRIKELGWDATRSGRSGEKPVVWLWITKD